MYFIRPCVRVAIVAYEHTSAKIWLNVSIGFIQSLMSDNFVYAYRALEPISVFFIRFNIIVVVCLIGVAFLAT